MMYPEKKKKKWAEEKSEFPLPRGRQIEKMDNFSLKEIISS